MSCIPKILELKGSADFLEVPSPDTRMFNRGIVVEGGGKYRGYDFIITFTDMGFRCGYVAIDSDHPSYHFSKNDDFPDYHVHGGVTFFERSHISKAILGNTVCEDKWIGFDAGHYGDLVDKDLTLKYFPDLRDVQVEHLLEMAKIFEIRSSDSFMNYRTREYMEEQCHHLIDQLIERRNEAI